MRSIVRWCHSYRAVAVLLTVILMAAGAVSMFRINQERPIYMTAVAAVAALVPLPADLFRREEGSRDAGAPTKGAAGSSGVGSPWPSMLVIPIFYGLAIGRGRRVEARAAEATGMARRRGARQSPSGVDSAAMTLRSRAAGRPATPFIS